jgi:ribosome-binding ATPase YchF (GTP1/OBG family)
MNIGLIGLPNSGKTTIFNALTRSDVQITTYTDSKTEPNRAVLEVADDRVATLSKMYKPKRTTFAAIELIDFVGLSQGSAKDGLFTASAMGLIKKLDDELLISDLIIAENRLDRIEKAYRRGKKTFLLEKEERLQRTIVDHLSLNRPIRDLELDEESEKIIRGFQFLTQKPIMIIVNSDENNFGKNRELVEKIAKHDRVIEFAGKFEMELSQLNDQEDMELFMADMGIRESAKDQLCRTAYELLGYISPNACHMTILWRAALKNRLAKAAC